MIRKLLALTILILVPQASEARTIYVHNNRGGEIHDFANRVDQSIANRDRVVLSGRVFSAATMWTKNPHACAMPGTTLGFHRGTIVATGQPAEVSTDQFYIQYHPLALQNVIQRGQLTRNPNSNVVYTISTPELWQFVPRCPSRHKRVIYQVRKCNIVINDPYGGMIKTEYLPRIAAAERAQARACVVGECGSACTYWTRYKHICAMPGSSFVFHASPAYPLGWGQAMPTNHWMYTLLPPHVRSYVIAHGGLRREELHVPADVLVPPC